MSSPDVPSNTAPPPNAQVTSTYTYMVILACFTLLRFVSYHNYIPIHALCGWYVQNTCWMNKWVNLEIPEVLNIVVICEHIRICSFIYRVMIKSLNMNFGERQVQVKSYIWHLKIVQPWESHLTTLSFSFLLFKITRLMKAIS